MEVVTVKLKLGTRAVKARPRGYEPTKSTWLAGCMAALAPSDSVFMDFEALWASPATGIPKSLSVTDYQAIYLQIQMSPAVISLHEAEVSHSLAAMCLGKLDLVQEHSYMALAPGSQEVLTFVAPEGLYAPPHGFEGTSNANF